MQQFLAGVSFGWHLRAQAKTFVAEQRKTFSGYGSFDTHAFNSEIATANCLCGETLKSSAT